VNLPLDLAQTLGLERLPQLLPLGLLGFGLGRQPSPHLLLFGLTLQLLLGLSPLLGLFLALPPLGLFIFVLFALALTADVVSLRVRIRAGVSVSVELFFALALALALILFFNGHNWSGHLVLTEHRSW
jgi:hypothetical protein